MPNRLGSNIGTCRTSAHQGGARKSYRVLLGGTPPWQATRMLLGQVHVAADHEDEGSCG